MTTRTVENEYQKEQLVKFVQAQEFPFTASLVKGKKRSKDQNALQWKWCQEIATQLGDRTANEVQAYNKLHFGVPILRDEVEAFRMVYDEFIKPHTYEQKLKLMEGDVFAVTRLMNTKQKTRYLDDVSRHWHEQGMILTTPQGL